jgi:hypothetical protein
LTFPIQEPIVTAQELLDTLNRMIRDDLIQPHSLVVIRSAGTIGEGIEMAIEKEATRVVAAEPQPGRRVVKIMGF